MRKKKEEEEQERLRLEAEAKAKADQEMMNINHIVIDLIEKMTNTKIKHRYMDLLYPKPPVLNQTYYDGSQYFGTKRSNDEMLDLAKKSRIRPPKLDFMNGESDE